MRATVKKWGNSMALRLPKAVLSENNLQEGTQLEITSKDGKIILEPHPKKIRDGWEEAAMKAHKIGDDRVMMDFSNEFDQKEWTW
jgi:antitoxin component of MazEF toxin-antitoxin module